MELQSEKVEAARRPQASPRTDFASSPFVAVQSSRKAAVRTEPAVCSAAAAVVGGGSGAVSAYCGNRAGGDTATFIGSVPVTVSLENFDGQHRIVCVTTDANGGTLSYVGQLNSDVNLELQAAVSPQPLLQGDGVSAVSTGNPLLQIHSLDTGSQRLQSVIQEGQTERNSSTKEVENDEPKQLKSKILRMLEI